MCDEYGAYSRCPYKGIPIYIMYKCIYPYYHTQPRALPHTAAHCPAHCRMTPARALPHTATLPYNSTHALPHCCTAAHCHTLPHTAALLPDSRALRCALPHITK